MLLIVNCIVDEDARARFDDVTVPRLAPVLGGDLEVRHLVTPDALSDHEHFDRLLLSGSELSAAADGPYDEALLDLVRSFATGGKPIVGICYGHQMAARALGARCRRAAVPEFGWKRVTTTENALFADLASPVVLHSHYDEIFDLPADFEVIGSTAECAVQAFQVADRPIWGVQFHPEMSHAEGQRMLDGNLETEPQARARYVDELTAPSQANANIRLFENFVGAVTRS